MSEFKFPDEVEKPVEEKIQIEVEGETEIEVVDDTPEEDRGRTPMKEPPSEVTDEELAQYTDGVKKRIQHFSKGYHEERRAKEAAMREREEALRLAKSLMEENQKLQNNVGQGQQALLEQAKKVVATELEQAKQKFKQAYESGDSDALVSAQEALTAAKLKAERVNNFKPAPLQTQKPVVQPAPEPPQNFQPDSKALAWQKANSWFGQNNRMTALAMEIHNELVAKGVDPSGDEYYGSIDAEMRKMFPDAFPSERTKKSSVVAPATRSTAPKKIVLTQSAINTAKRLGLTPEQYAREVAKLERNQNG